MMNRDHQPTNEELLTPKKEHWQRQVRNTFTLKITVESHGMPEELIMKFGKKVEDLVADSFKNGNAKYTLE